MPSKIEELVDEPPTSINPYRVLDIEKDATADQIKTAYRKAALKHHPDKVVDSEKDAANVKFQEIAFAYAVLSDPRRRSRYDATGRTSESLHLDDDDDDFNWSDFFRTQFKEVVTEAAIQQFKAEYVGSEEEQLAIIEAYITGEGDMDHVFAHVMLSSPLDDDARFRAVIDAEIAAKRVEAYPAYTHETKQRRKRREKEAQKEEREAVEMAREMGIEDQLFGSTDGGNMRQSSSSSKRGATTNGNSSKKKQSGKGHHSDDGDRDGNGNENSTSGLAALIQQRQKQRAGDFLADLEAKYAPKKGKKKQGKRKASDLDDDDDDEHTEPPEEAFQRTAERYNKRSSSGATTKQDRPIASPRKSKRSKT